MTKSTKIIKNENFFKAVELNFEQAKQAYAFEHGTNLKKADFYKEVAKELGLTYETVRQLLSGKPYYVPNLYNAIKLSNYFKTDVQKMYDILD